MGRGAIGTAAWTGLRLGDLLRAAGVPEGADRHVAFEGHDAVEGQPYGVSIPLAAVLAPETLLAFAMNGEPLLPEHGFPLRAVVPGFAGVRSPKRLRRITVQDRPSDNPIQAGDYKGRTAGPSRRLQVRIQAAWTAPVAVSGFDAPMKITTGPWRSRRGS